MRMRRILSPISISAGFTPTNGGSGPGATHCEHRSRSGSAGAKIVKRAAGVLLALSLTSCGNKTTQEKRTGPWFEDIASVSGINFVHKSGATGQFYMPEIMGSGAALLDYDGDGDLDILLLQGAPFDNLQAGHGIRLYRNELNPSGKLQFTDVTREAGIDYAG